MANVTVKIGDLFTSRAQTLVNTVNCVGVMGKGIALGFKQRFPKMFDDYEARCRGKQVRLGEPYLYKGDRLPWILNFPTKDHWRGLSRISDIARGLEFLAAHYKQWGITSLAVPPLGCGNGQLDWMVVGPTLFRYLSKLEVPVELYAPDKTPKEQMTLSFLQGADPTHSETSRDREPLRVDAWAVAIVAVLSRIGREQFRRPIGRTAFQKIAYFLSEAGIPTGLVYERGSYGPYSAQLKSVLSRLINNGLVVETERNGKLFEVQPGPTYRDAREHFKEQLREWVPMVEKVADLLLRFPTTSDLEIGATALFVAKRIAGEKGGRPTEREIFDAIMAWKAKRRPPVDPDHVALTVRQLGVMGWLDASPTRELPVRDPLDEFESAA
jgi:O-acetyl-ADP-ribose deacetylase (regulator of RNase III)